MKELYRSPETQTETPEPVEETVPKLPVIDNPAPSQDEPPKKPDNTKLNVIIIAVVIILVIGLLVYYFRESKKIAE